MPSSVSACAAATHFTLQVGIGDGAGVAWLSLEVDGHAVAGSGSDVAVDTVGGDVEASADEPLREGCS